MAVTAIDILKSWFETGDKPTQTQFASLIDSFRHKLNAIEFDDFSDELQTLINNLGAQGTIDIEFKVVLDANGVSADGSTYTNDQLLNKRVRVSRNGIGVSKIDNGTGNKYTLLADTNYLTFTLNLTPDEILKVEIF